MRATTKFADFQRKIACSTCGKLGHRPAHCNGRPKAYDRLGIEIEGWWKRERMAEIREIAESKRCTVKTDGSLSYDSTGETEAWEIVTPPCNLGAALTMVHDMYPDKYDHSAGMHIHMSFHDHGDISSLMTREFCDYAMDKWRNWGTRCSVNPESQFWKRLRGDNRYCGTLSDYDLERGTRGDRYRWLNFSSWDRHRTVELRLLPLFGSEALAQSAIAEWVEIVERYIQMGFPIANVQYAVPQNVLPPEEHEAEVIVPEAQAATEIASEVSSFEIPSADAALGQILTTRAGAVRVLRENLGL